MLSWYDWNFTASTGLEDTTPIPNWFWLFGAINIFLAYTLDGVDGKLARRIGLSGPLGELFDHGNDSMCLVHINDFMFVVAIINVDDKLEMITRFYYYGDDDDDSYTHIYNHISINECVCMCIYRNYN